MNPALQQNILQLVYATFLHNSDAIALFLSICLVVFLLFKKPSRRLLFFLVGFTALLIRLEYIKHIADPLQSQTLGVLVTGEGFAKTRRLSDIFFNDLIPFVLYLVGWGGMLLGIAGNMLKKKKD